MNSDTRSHLFRRGSWFYQATRFVPVGVLAVAIDFFTYLSMLWLGFPPMFAKAIGFAAGAIFAFIGSKRFVFRRAQNGFRGVLKFAFVYGNSLILNIVTNDLILAMTDSTAYLGLLVGFCVATSVSALFNFLGMKLIVFVGDDL